MATILQGQKVTAGYGAMDIVRDVSFVVREAQVVAIVGPNGSGKSTLVKSVFGLCDVHSGEIHLDQHDLRKVRGDKINGLGIGYVPQTANVFTNLTIKENMELGAMDKNDEWITNRVQELSSLFPILNARSNQRTGLLSGGERQMVAIARALMSKPKIILLDEPTAMLSPKYANDIFRIISELRDLGIGIMLIEQNARKALEFAEHAYVMIQGHVEFEGSGSEILSNEEVEHLYLGKKRVIHNRASGEDAATQVK